MTINDRSRTHAAAVHAYTLPIVREVPIHAAAWPGSDSEQSGRPLAYAASSHAW
jgi:hypothetical protein